MPGPAPPPPPPPPQPTSGASGAGQDGRGRLLESIRAGKTLKKTVTVDKSAPVIGGRTTREDAAGARAPSGGASNVPAAGAPNLGGLFSGGMPKLKATGLRSDVADKESPSGQPVAAAPAPSTKRGPPPVPPPATQKPQTTSRPSDAELAPARPNFGKPALAPKPPQPAPLAVQQKPSPPPKKLNLFGGTSVSRAQSMRLPRSPPVPAPAIPSSLHQSQDCLNEVRNRQQQQQQQQQYRPAMNRALRPPVARPPSPPTSKTLPREAPQQPPPPATTRVAPPPPSRLAVTAPSMPPPPPPPPYRSISMHQRLAPPPPPTPPTRIASAALSSPLPRNGSGLATSLDLELRFADKFRSIANFPNPSPFRGFAKVYNSRNAAKQQAPAPPPLQSASAPGTMLRLNPSPGAKQSRSNAEAASSANEKNKAARKRIRTAAVLRFSVARPDDLP